MLEKRILERIINEALESTADFAEVFAESTMQNTLSMQDSALQNAKTNELKGVGIRIAKGHKSVYGHTNKTDEASLISLTNDLKTAFPVIEFVKQLHLENSVMGRTIQSKFIQTL